MDPVPPPRDPDEPPFTQADVIRDVLAYGAVGLSLGISSGMTLVRRAPETVAAAVPQTVWELLRGVLWRLPLAAWPFLLVLALYGFGSLFFRAGPERGIARTAALGLMLMLGRLIIAG